MKCRLRLLCLVLCFAAVLLACSRGSSEEGPIWLWGLPSSYGGRDIPEEVLTQANEWALEKFGATFRLTSVPEPVSNVAALNLLVAKGEFPDVVVLGFDQYNLLAVQKTITDLARRGKILPLDKYFVDEKNYPHLHRAGQVREQMLMGAYDDKIYAAPGKGTRLDDDEPAWAEPMWAVRRDIAQDHGMPEDLQQLIVTLKAIKQGAPGQYTDETGQAVAPLGVYPDVDQWTSLVYQLKGAGWEVDDQMRLMPSWASQETHEALKAVNLLWREGLLHPDAFTMDADRAAELAKGGSYGVTCGPASFVSQAEAPRENVMLVPPIRETDGSFGRYLSQAPGLVVISTECPNVDAVMRLMDWCLSREGWISAYLDAGMRGIDWEFADAPLNWEYKATQGSNYPRPEGVQSGTRRSLIQLTETPAKVLPGIQYLSSATAASQGTWANYSWLNAMKVAGVPARYSENGFTVAPWDVDFNMAVTAKVVSDWPSYSLMAYDIEPMEANVMEAARMNWREGLYGVLMADSAAEFENRYLKLIEGLVSAGDWTAVYKARQATWEGWLDENYDDRDNLHTATPRPEWQLATRPKPVRQSAESLQDIYRGLPSYQDIIVQKDIVYATMDGVDLKLDMAKPAVTDGPVPGIVLIHDSWRGDRGQMFSFMRVAALRGYVAVTIDYRGETLHEFPAQVTDVACAVRWLRANATKHGLDSSRIGVMGVGGGARNALLIGFMDESHPLYGVCEYSEHSSRVQAIVNMSGATEMRRFYETSTMTFHVVPATVQEVIVINLGGEPEAIPDRYSEASPVTHISADDPPVLTIHREDSASLPFEQAELMDARLKEHGIPHTIRGYVYAHAAPAYDQGVANKVTVPASDDTESEEYTGTLIEVLFEFFDRYLGGSR